jgi:peptidoglycan/xylan/chitin deacetylase (PgdA/CDA1 family)
MRSEGIPVLNYHAIDDNEPLAATRNVSVSLSSFKEQVQWLAAEGFRSVQPHELRDLLLHKRPVAGRNVLFTFDDGYHSLYKHAMPIMAQYGFTGTLFLSTCYIGNNYNLHDFEFVNHDRQLTWDELKALSAAGWSIQSHGHNHVKMNGLDTDALANEVVTSKRMIEEHLGTVVDEFAFPYGLYNKKVLDQLVGAGYKFAYSVHSGKLSASSNKFRLPRIEINNMDTMETYKTKVLTGYISPRNARRSKIRDIIYANATVKDLIERWTPYFGFGNH